MRFADTHCHLDFSEFDESRTELISRCRSSAIELIVVPAVKRETWHRALALSGPHQEIYVGLGLHPYFISDHRSGDIADLERLLKGCSSVEPSLLLGAKISAGAKIVAVGEIGLDATIGNLDAQRFYFSKQLKLAEAYQLPVILHSRKTHNEVIKVVRSFNLAGGVIHAFSGGIELLGEFIRSGLKIGVGGVITWPTAVKTRKAIAQAPLESLVLETDSPDMHISNNKSTPLDVLKVFEVMCAIRDESPNLIAKQLWENSRALFFRQK